jgi:nucleoside-diphosphate-sugar epimerase
MNALTGYRSEIDLVEGLRETVAYYKTKLPEIAARIL